jgi:hypothetical protein
LRSTRLSCLHLKMKMMTTVNRKLMLEWIKRMEWRLQYLVVVLCGI